MKIEQLSAGAKRYQLAETMIWAKLENWQKLAITQDRAAQKSSTVFDSFTKQVIALAESAAFAPKDTIPPSKPLKKSLTPTNN